MGEATIRWQSPRPQDGVSYVNEGSDIPTMRARSGRRGSDVELAKLLASALDNLSHANCSFWACEGPSRPRGMCTCVKCWAMLEIATVHATLQARGRRDG